MMKLLYIVNLYSSINSLCSFVTLGTVISKKFSNFGNNEIIFILFNQIDKFFQF